tara:strand:- start:10609 stop:12486 length:1878 start_codon:yes stop_codon:yes gene_type:complete
VVEKNFSKCQCPQAGWCDLLKKEMTATPPNWQWCQGLTEEERKQYHDSVNGKTRTLKRASSEMMVDLINFVDDIPTPTSDYAVCVIPANQSAMDLLDITRETIKTYAEKCGADYIELTGDQHPEWPMANKYRLYNVTSVYEKTLYLDCDVVVKEDAENIFDCTPDDKISLCDDFKSFAQWNDTDWIQKEQELLIHKIFKNSHKMVVNGKFTSNFEPNAGVMVIPNSCSKLYCQPEVVYPKQWCFDQHWLALNVDKDKFEILDDKWNCRTAGPTNSRPKSPVPHEFWETIGDANFVHVNGLQKILDLRKGLLKRFANGNFKKIANEIYPVKFISNEELVRDSIKLLDQIPPVAGVVGIPRSGMTPATTIATVLSLPLYGISDGKIVKLNSISKNGGARMSEQKENIDLPFLVIDDTSFSGGAMIRTRNNLEQNYPEKKFIYTSVYHEPSLEFKKYNDTLPILDAWNIELPFPHILQWNLFNTYQTEHTMFDMDGVFNADCTVEIDANEEMYIDWMLSVKPIKHRLPLSHPADAICTGRPEKYRKQTEYWLKLHGIKYNDLHMWPGTKEERDAGGLHSKNVAAFKSEKFNESQSIIFVESCDIQSKFIAKNKNKGKYVVSIDRESVY